MNAAAKVTNLHHEAQERLERVSSGHEMGTTMNNGELSSALEILSGTEGRT